eukprot:CAMPEP_0170519910 /NCGR_PEP_ID=MMETSP0209-20121228/5144_1 /TAXON_ID=665100 ORGANISM="Litonotus pictus, Strain P1" /NCGR_SAMPLE_ID=MMETSP0209 /ASSEMBLY_ACC=CAM_ASM_000301 /LENGTH=824 /DNA_ID=CAMNT_0010805901 /DNA_START=200 /DNA_END=2674 /DNA_ORIENTATION=+
MMFSEKKPEEDPQKEKEKQEEEKEDKEDKEKEENKDKEGKDKFTKEEEETINVLVASMFRFYKYDLHMIGYFALGLLFWYLYNKHTSSYAVKEIVINDLIYKIQNQEIKEILVTKFPDENSWKFFLVEKHHNSNETFIKNKIIYERKDELLSIIFQQQLDQNIPEKDYIRINFVPDSPNNPNPNIGSFLGISILSLVFLIGSKIAGRKLFSTANNINIVKKADSRIKEEAYRRFKEQWKLNNGQYIPSSTKKSGKSSKPTQNSGLGGNLFSDKLNSIFDTGKSNAREYGTEEQVKVKFQDVAGNESAKLEIIEFVDFLKNPEKYNKLGAKIPRGALLLGPPGTGKTLLAKSVAGESGVPFFAISGSDFVEMYVGVGASRVRDLFKKARSKSPSIIFIDEIDAIGKKRGGSFMKNDERDNTLNQLLVEMDGFTTDSNVIVLAATNRQDVLDKALLRPGRFDRQVEINHPDRGERIQILKIYLKKVKLNKEVSIDEYAERLSTLTPGYTGADLSNLVNEAAILAARDNKKKISMVDFEKASERVLAGLETNRTLSKIERKTVAYHEAGHAIVGWFLKHCSPIVKITIIPRSKGALGFTQYLPDEQSLMTREQIIDSICMTLGGRMAEEKFFNRITSGAYDDLQKVTQMARGLVTRFGMSNLGYRVYNVDGEGFQKDYSEETDRLIDSEVNSIINECAKRTREVVEKYKEQIEKIAEKLLDKETIDILDVIKLIGDRPHKLPSSMEAYLKETQDRREREAKEEENKGNNVDNDSNENGEGTDDTKEAEGKDSKSEEGEARSFSESVKKMEATNPLHNFSNKDNWERI